MDRPAEARFERILAEHGPALRRVAAAYGADASDAEDLFQDICFAIWRALPSFRGESSERTWAFRIGHNRGLTHRLRRRETAELDPAVQDRSPGPDAQATAALERERLQRAVRRLSLGQRQVVTLSLEGFTPREIAEILGLTENVVAVRLTRARRALRELLGEDR